MVRKIALWTILGIFSLGCVTGFVILVQNAVKTESIRSGVKENRAKKARQAQGPIVIGVAGGWGKGFTSVQNGVQLAMEEINRSGGVLGRPLETVFRDDQMAIAAGIQVAQEFSENLDMVAVIGHMTSTVSLVTSLIYEYNGVLMLSPLATNPSLTQQGRRFVFRNIATNDVFGSGLADYAFRQGYRRIAIYYLQDTYSRGLANIFERRCYELGITIVDRLPYEPTDKENDFSADLELWKKQFNFDALMLAGQMPQISKVITEIRQVGITEPIISGDSLDNTSLIQLAGKAAKGITFASTFDPEGQQPEVTAFIKAYDNKYNTLPDRNAAQGYDALRLLAHVIKKGGSTVPEHMAATLRETRNWQGATGSQSFNANGDLMDAVIVLKEVKNGEFHVIH
jgi:branched-chain amino acid transport system substrate-binding protein